MDLITYFNNNNRNKYWQKNSAKYKKWFRRQLKHLLLEIEEGVSEEEMNSFIYRLGLGYWGIGKQSGIPSGIKTEDSITKPSTNDHLFGTVEIGRYIHKELEKNNLDINYMVDFWLHENLWLWMTIKVSKEEHRKENIERNVHSIENKIKLEHYKKVSQLIFKNKI